MLIIKESNTVHLRPKVKAELLKPPLGLHEPIEGYTGQTS